MITGCSGTCCLALIRRTLLIRVLGVPSLLPRPQVGDFQEEAEEVPEAAEPVGSDYHVI